MFVLCWIIGLRTFLATDSFKIPHLSFILCTTLFLHDQPSVPMLLWYTYSVPYLTPSPAEVFIMNAAVPNFTFSVPPKLNWSLAHTQTPSPAKVSTHTIF